MAHNLVIAPHLQIVLHAERIPLALGVDQVLPNPNAFSKEQSQVVCKPILVKVGAAAHFQIARAASHNSDALGALQTTSVRITTINSAKKSMSAQPAATITFVTSAKTIQIVNGVEILELVP